MPTGGAPRVLPSAVSRKPPPRSGPWRNFIEGNAIALLSNHERTPLDLASPGWLGHFSDRSRVRGSGFWNQQHVDETHDPVFLDALEEKIDAMRRGN